MAKKEENAVPLEQVKELSYLEEDGEVIVSYRSRGFLRDMDVRDTKPTLHKRIFRPNGKEALAALADRLRAHLDAKDLPTDKTEVIPIERDWGYDPDEYGIVADEDLWFGIAQDSTEPLTVDRLAAELLHAITRLHTKFNDDELSDIFRAMYVYHLHSAAGELNELAIDGETSRKNRAKGWQARKETGSAQRKLILAIAQDFWERFPNLEGQVLNTARKIEVAVNQARTNQFPKCKPLAAKTISDRLREALIEAGDVR
ncbi:hypothetical protein ACNJYD_02675 [Bradyrhizobium sp. DASA03005]|uniref:hypothetical protein n=1 Tax=Bradyrhizobium sp. SPXBL-02 TaxID=3395912 RepID=UPI003F6E933A